MATFDKRRPNERLIARAIQTFLARQIQLVYCTTDDDQHHRDRNDTNKAESEAEKIFRKDIHALFHCIIGF